MLDKERILIDQCVNKYTCYSDRCQDVAASYCFTVDLYHTKSNNRQ
jgi:hypothetical protein